MLDGRIASAKARTSKQTSLTRISDSPWSKSSVAFAVTLLAATVRLRLTSTVGRKSLSCSFTVAAGAGASAALSVRSRK